MRTRPSNSRGLALLLLAGVGIAALAAACNKPEPAVVDAGPPPAPVATDAAPAVLTPLDEDAAADVDAAPAAVHHGGPGLSTNQLRAKQCCNALRAQGKTDPIIMTIATQCDAVAMQMGASGQAPEFGALRQMLKGHNIPAVCSGL